MQTQNLYLTCDNCEASIRATLNNYVAFDFNPSDDNDVGDTLILEDYLEKYSDSVTAVQKFQCDVLILCIPCHKASLNRDPKIFKDVS